MPEGIHPGTTLGLVQLAVQDLGRAVRIELYRDRPREGWRESGGELRMGTYELNPDELLTELEGPEPPEQEGPRLGHVYLEVSDLAASDRYYLGVLGFQLMMRLGPSASFVSAGGYHHHIGYNTWAGHLAPVPARAVLGLQRFSVRLPEPAALEAVAERVRRAGLPLEQDGGVRRVRDPSGIRLTLECGDGEGG
jgi:catechol 2,3-dioxygenase